MNVVNSIIEDLSDHSKSLTSPILRTKVLATRIGQVELAQWADRELIGYPPPMKVPEYRRGKPVFRCTIQQGYETEENIPLPLMIFDKEARERLLKFDFTDSIATLELTLNQGQSIYKEFPADLCHFLTSKIENRKVNNFNIVKLNMHVNISGCSEVLIAVRSKLLDFMLRLEVEVPNIENLSNELVSSQPYQNKINGLFHQTINIAGNNNTIAAGSGNVVG